MPRKARIDYPGGVHQLIVPGIERKPIFQDDQDCEAFIDRLGFLLEKSKKILFWLGAVAQPWRSSRANWVDYSGGPDAATTDYIFM